MLQAERLVNMFLNIHIKRHCGNGLDDKSEDHVIDVAVDMFCTWRIIKRRSLNHLQRGLFILRVEAACNTLVWILRIGREAGGMMQNINNSQGIFSFNFVGGVIREPWNIFRDKVGRAYFAFVDQLL